MSTLKELERHLASIPAEKWIKLFDLIPRMENATSLGKVRGGEPIDDQTFSTHYWEPSMIVGDFFRIVHELDIIPVFDWMNWKEGGALLKDPGTDYAALPAVTLCKLLTVIFRTERFSEGFLAFCFEEGVILRILKGLREKVI